MPKTAFRVVKDGLSQAEKPSFANSSIVSANIVDGRLLSESFP